MRKRLVAGGVLLAALAGTGTYFALLSRARTAEVNSYAAANYELANRLFFDSLDEGEIDIFALPPAKPACFRAGGYDVRLRPLDTSLLGRAIGARNFVEHNHGCVLMFACHMWDKDRKFALWLVRYVSGMHRNARTLYWEIEEKGADHEDVARRVRDTAWQYEHRRERYSPASGAPERAAGGRTPLEEAVRLNLVLEPELDRAELERAFDELVACAREEIEDAASPQETILVLNRVILADREVTYLSNKHWRDSTLAACVLRRRGNCMATSTCYALVAAELGLPVGLVIVPGHAFVRWDDGETRINIETVHGGAEVTDDAYASWHPFTPEDAALIGFGESRDADGMRVELLVSAARHRVGEDRLEDAARYVDRALELAPGRLDLDLWRMGLTADITSDRGAYRRELEALLERPSLPPSVRVGALSGLAYEHGSLGDHERERTLLMRAFAAAPSYAQPGILRSLACCHRARRDSRSALRCAELALAFHDDARDPRRPGLLYTLAIMQKNDGRLDEALASISEARKGNPEMWGLKMLEAGYTFLDGRREEGLALFARAREGRPRGQEQFYSIMVAWSHAVTGERDEFYRTFAHALSRCRGPRMLHWIDEDVDLDPYRDEPEFRRLVAEYRARILGAGAAAAGTGTEDGGPPPGES